MSEDEVPPADELADLVRERAELEGRINRALVKRRTELMAGLRERREQLGLRQSDVAAACGITREQIANAESGKVGCSMEVFLGYLGAVGGRMAIAYDGTPVERTTPPEG